MSGNIEITLKRSPIGHPEKHRKILIGLGLNRLNKSVVRKDTPETRGMVQKVSHMVSVKEAE